MRAAQVKEGWSRCPAALVTLVFSLIVGMTAMSAETNPAVPAAQKRGVQRGRAYFKDYCASCHLSDGRGVEDEGPPLAGSFWVKGPEIRLVKILLHGMRGRITVGGKTYNREMAGFGERLSDSEIASLLSFVRRRWGGQTAPVKSKTVSRVRAAFPNRRGYWTVEELLQDR
jgi:mono/diheme cytochrome c family protein